MTKQKTQAQLNADFEALEPWKKRVAIARDALVQIASGRIQPSNRATYVDTVDEAGFGYIHNETEICDLLAKEECTVCGIGGLFAGAIALADNFKVKNLAGVSHFTSATHVIITGDDVRAYLGRFFSQGQLVAIEAAFEQNQRRVQNHIAGDVFAPAVTDPETRLRLILENIIANQGEFDWTVQPVPVAEIRWKTPYFSE